MLNGVEVVESCRQAVIDYCSGEIESREPLTTELKGLSSHQQRIVARAFTAYFELINLAEKRERIRTIRTDSHKGILDDSLETAAKDLSEAEMGTSQLPPPG